MPYTLYQKLKVCEGFDDIEDAEAYAANLGISKEETLIEYEVY